MAEIVFQAPELLLLLPVAWLILIIAAWPRRFRPFGAFLLRLFIIVLAIVALAGPVIPESETLALEKQERAVILVDQSLSLSETEQAQIRTEASRLAQQFSSAEVLYFADQATLLPFATQPGESGVDLDPELSNLAEALTIGHKLLSQSSGRIVLLSDGLPTAGPNLDPILTKLAQAQIPVDVLLLGEASLDNQNDLRLLNLRVPAVLREGETFDVEVILYSDIATTAFLQLTQDETPLAESEIDLEAGPNLFTFTTSAETLGPHTFVAAVTPLTLEDPEAINNRFSAFTQVYPPSRILIVGDELAPASRFVAQLDEAGFITERISSAQLPTDLTELDPYAGMVLLNVSAQALELEQMIAIQEFVRSLGRGLVVSGGRESFTLGEYEDTPLEEVLPLDLEPPPREERPPVALLLVIDHSGSMMEGNPSNLAMAKEAAIRATDILGPDDLIGILIFDNRLEWVIPFQPASDGATLLDIQSQIATIDLGGGTRILPALEEGLAALTAQNTFNGPRHAVLFSDGKSFDDTRAAERYDEIVEAAGDVDITLSTIAIGDEADRDLLSHLAELGKGRYHVATRPDELPALTIAESDILRSSAVQEGEYRPAVFAPHPMLRGLSPQGASLQESQRLEMPNLSGYIAMTPKPQAEIVLQVGPGDPLLGVWGYGLGRVAAWSADTGTEWATAWDSWPEAPRFWGQVIGYTLPAPNLGLLQLSATFEPGGVATLVADGVTATGESVDLAQTQATLMTPSGREVPVNLRQVSPGRYQQRLRLPDAGVYQFTVNQSRGDDQTEQATIGFVLPYPAEYGLADEAAGQNLLGRIATVTEGRVFSLGQALPPTACNPDSEPCTAENLLDLENSLALWPWLIAAALLLWPLEIAWRRWGHLRIQ